MSIHGRSRSSIRRGTSRRAFTLIELLVVVAIIALLISILLPSLRDAREQARAVVCGQQMRDLGNGIAAYFAEHNDWIPGTNTSGVATAAHNDRGRPELLQDPSIPTQVQDWITPIRSEQMEMPASRAARLREVTNEFGCPSQVFNEAQIYTAALPSCPDRAEIQDMEGPWRALSYMMPEGFQLWGLRYDADDTGNPYRIALAQHETRTGRNIWAETQKPFFSAVHQTFKSRLQEIGNPSQKLCAADGTRYLTATGILDFDPSPNPEYFGSFTSSGAWWSGSTAYGVKKPSQNWNNRSLPSSSDPPAQGNNIPLSYRHGSRNVGTTAHSNSGRINALFFDGSVRRLGDKQSRNPVLWYPRGTEIMDASEGMIDDLQNGDRVP